MKVKYQAFFVIILVIYFMANSSLADIGSLDSRQSNIFPLKSTDISMAKEKVIITLYDDSVLVEAKFWMFNDNNQSTVKTGFPFYNDHVWKFQDIRNFKCTVNGEPINFKIDKSKKSFGKQKQKYIWYYWDTIFSERDTTIVELNYTGVWGESGFGPEKYFNYIIGTANTWKGPIGYGEVVFDHTNFLSDNFILTCKDSSFDGNMVPTTIRSGITVEYLDNKTCFVFDNYYPEENETVNITFLDLSDIKFDEDWQQYFKSLFQCQSYTKEILYKMKNELLARRGYAFDDVFLSNYFSSKSWYVPDSTITFNNLSKGEHNLYKIISELEGEF